jgi:glycosyltransferase involved in cell wall biosynthesis
MEVSNILFISGGYPSKNNPQFIFLAELIHAFADKGIACTVIAPQSITKDFFRRNNQRPFNWIDQTSKGNIVTIYQPKVVTFSKLKIFGWSISALISKRAIIRTYKKIGVKPDIIYSHFWDNGVVAGEVSNKYDLPFVVATGESKIWVKGFYHDKYIKKRLMNLSGVISVSTKNLDESKSLGLGTDIPSIVLPNAIDTAKFKELDKQALRNKYNFPQGAFIISFLGAFIERKGPLRLLDAVKSLADPSVKILYIGAGTQEPKGDSVLFKGRLPHDVVPEYLSCSDVFVLPTLAEGCSNAIVEAMACGLPIISSNLPFNTDILDDSNAILVDPMNVEEIAEAIQKLKKDSNIHKTMSACSYKKAGDLSINSRAMKILRFIDEECVTI